MMRSSREESAVPIQGLLSEPRGSRHGAADTNHPASAFMRWGWCSIIVRGLAPMACSFQRSLHGDALVKRACRVVAALRFVILGLLFAVGLATNSLATTDAERIARIRQVWDVSDLTDDLISTTLNTSYRGVPYKEWVDHLFTVYDVQAALSARDYNQAVRIVVNFGFKQGLNALIDDTIFASVFGIARLAAWPIEQGLNGFADAVVKKAYARQLFLYRALRDAGNSHEAIVALEPADLLDAPGINGGVVTKTDQRWLTAGFLNAFAGYPPSPLTPQLFFEQAQRDYDFFTVRMAQLASDSARLKALFTQAARPASPLVTVHPRGQTIDPGQSTTLSVSATGTAPLNYLWRKDGVAQSGVNAPSLLVNSAGDYLAEVSNAFGKDVSDTATIVVRSAQSISLTAPAAGATVANVVTVRATAPDATNVEFFLDGVKMFTDSSPPFTWSWDNVGVTDGSHTLSAKAYNGAAILGTSSTVTVTVNNAATFSDFDEHEPNDSSLKSTTLVSGNAASGRVSSPTDVDWFKIEVTTPGVLAFNLTVPVGKDYDLELFGPDAAYIKGSYGDTGVAESISYNAATTGTYYVRVYGYPVGNGSFSASQGYSLLPAISVGAQLTFTPLGVVPGSRDSYARGLSADAGTIVGTYEIGPTGSFVWTRSDGMVKFHDLTGDANAIANGISADGLVFVGSTLNSHGKSQAFRWSGPGGFELLPFLTGETPIDSAARATSGDGAIVVGRDRGMPTIDYYAVRWSAGGAQKLGLQSGYAAAVSADGTVVIGSNRGVGLSNAGAFRWTADAGMQGLGTISGHGYSSVATAVSSDGSVVVGTSGDTPKGDRAFRWTGGEGILPLGELGPTYGSYALAVSPDGQITGGYFNAKGTIGWSDLVAVVWDANRTCYNLQSLVAAAGVDLTGWELKQVAAVVGAGSVYSVAGTGLHDGHFEAFLIDGLSVPSSAGKPTFASPPANQAAVPGANATFTVAASGSPAPILQWQVSINNGTSWSDLADNALYSGANAGTLHVTAANLTLNGYLYRCVATNSVGTTISAAAVLTVNIPPVGPVVAWGDNSYGQSTMPAGLSGVSNVAAGGNFTVALKNDGTVVAWGDNTYGQTDVPAGLGGVIAIAAGTRHTLALKTDGTVVAWGYNQYGQTAVPAGLNGVIAIAAAGSFYGGQSVALKNDGTVVAWGDNGYAALGVPSDLSGVMAIAAGGQDGYGFGTFTLALKTDGTVVAWGWDVNGQATVPPGLNGVTAVAAGNRHAVALRNNGTVVAWGSNSDGQIGVPAGLSGVIAIAAGSYHTVALKSDGTVVAWGRSSSGQVTVPAGLAGVTSIAAGRAHTVALVGAPTAQAPTITAQPADQIIDAGQNASFTVVANGTPALSYQWQRQAAGTIGFVDLADGGAYTGATTASLSVSYVSGAMSGDQFRCVASNSVIPDAISNAVTLTVVSSINFHSWQSDKFSSGELTDLNVSGPNAVFSADGLPNLVKYALGLDPRIPAASDLPEVKSIGSDWTYTYTRPADRSDLTYAVEVSTNLVTWTTVGVTHEMIAATNGSETWRARHPISPASNLFFRLKVSTQ